MLGDTTVQPLTIDFVQGAAAREFSFQLDPFQQVAVNCLEAGPSIIIKPQS